MATVNQQRKGIGAKLVYYGPPGTGKTTNLSFLNRSTVNPAELMSVPHDEGRTVSFFLPIEPRVVHGVELRVRVSTVQTVLEGDPAWAPLLSECDAVVFVADSSRAAVEVNRRYVRLLNEELKGAGLAPSAVPVILQLNRQDVPDAMSPDEAVAALGAERWSATVAIAFQGQGVVETAALALQLLCKSQQRKFKAFGGVGELAEQARIHLGAPEAAGSAPAASVEAVPLPSALAPSAAASGAVEVVPLPSAGPPPAPPADEELVIEAEADPVAAADAGAGEEEVFVEEIVVPDEAAEPALLVGLSSPPAPRAAEVEPSDFEVAATLDPQPALAALGHLRQCAEEAQARLGAVAALKGRIESAVECVGQLQDSVSSLSATLATLAVEHGEASAPAAEGSDAGPGQVSEVEALIAGYHERVTALEQALERTRAAAAGAVESREQVRAAEAEVANLRALLEARMAEAEQQLTAEAERAAGLAAELAATQQAAGAAVAAAEQSASDVMRLQGELSSVREALGEAMVAAEAAQSSAAEVERLAGERAQLQAELAAAEERVLLAEQSGAEAREQLALAVSAGESLQNQLALLQANQAAADTSQQQVEELAARLQQAEAAAAEAEQKAGSAEAGREDLAQVLGNYQQIAARLQQDAKEKDAQLAQLKAAVEEKDRELAALRGGAVPAKRPSAPGAGGPGAKPPSRPSSGSTPTGMRSPAKVAGSRTPAPIPPPDPFAGDPNHQAARSIAKALVAELAKNHLPAVMDAVAKGNFDEVFGPQIQGLRQLYESHVPAPVLQTHDHLQDEINGLLAEIRKTS